MYIRNEHKTEQKERKKRNKEKIDNLIIGERKAQRTEGKTKTEKLSIKNNMASNLVALWSVGE